MWKISLTIDKLICFKKLSYIRQDLRGCSLYTAQHASLLGAINIRYQIYCCNFFIMELWILQHAHAIGLQICSAVCSCFIRRVYSLGFSFFIYLFVYLWTYLSYLIIWLDIRFVISHIPACVLMLVANCSPDPCGPSVMYINEGRFTSRSSRFEAD